MPRYIDADAAVEEARLAYCKDCNSYNGVKCRACAFDDAMLYIEDHPAADVVPKSECMMCGEMTGKVIVQLQEQISELNKRQFPSYCQAFSEEEAINTGRQYGKAEAAREIIDDILEALQGESDLENTRGREDWEKGDTEGYHIHQYAEDKLDALVIALSLYKKKYTGDQT